MNHDRYKFFRRTTIIAVLITLGGGLLLTQAMADDVDVDVNGVHDPLLTNVRKSLSVAGKHKDPWSANQVERLYRLAPKEIKQALQPYGYYNANIKTSLDKPSGDSKTWHAHFKVDHGPATRITRINIAANGPGEDTEALQQAMASTQLETEKRLVQSQYTATKSAMYNAAYQAGYLGAKFDQSAIRVNPKTNTAEIDLVLNTGERYYFGPVTFDQDLLNDKFVHRFVPFEAGQPFNADDLINLQLALSNSDYYSQIAISAPREDAVRTSSGDSMNQWFYDLLYPPKDALDSVGQLQIPITVQAKPSKPQHYRISGGYGTDTGPRVGFGVKFRHLNQYGHQFSTNLRISQIQRTLQSSYDIPIQNVATDKLSFTGTISNQKFGDITSNLFGVGIVRDISWRLGRRRAYLKLEREYYDLGNGNRSSTLLYPGYNFTLKKADDLLFTHKGVSLSMDVRGGSSALLSETNFFRADVSSHVILPVTSTVRLVMRGELGAIQASDFRDLPPSQRFFAGGESSVRGYSYQSISPTNSDKDDIGGKYLAATSIEADWFFYNKFGAATFFDAGDVSNSTHLSLKKGAGIGFRWASPVGMVHLDLAHPFDDPDSNYAIGFSLGSDL